MTVQVGFMASSGQSADDKEKEICRAFEGNVLPLHKHAKEDSKN